MELAKLYEPQKVESDIYDQWEKSGAFRSTPDGRPHAQTYTIVIPPPNVTGALHLGHALNNTLQDMMVRYHRMRGFNTLWQPGCDHAGIATQAVVERRIRETEGKSRHDLGREELVRRIWEWKDEYEKRILSQLKLMGCSCDWERSRFTLDDGLAKAVRLQFFNLFKDGLIFRGKRLVNWDTELQTAVANDEVYYETIKGKFWHFKYPVIEPQPGEPEFVIIATTRPETMLGDTAVAVSADPEGELNKADQKLRDNLAQASEKDKLGIQAKIEAIIERRETHLPQLITLAKMAQEGRKLRLPLVDREIPLITDQHANPTLGSGCVKITPAHDPNDYEVGMRQAPPLPMINVLTKDGKVARIVETDGSENPNSKKYEGLIFAGEGRDTVVADMQALGLVPEIEDREREVGHSDRSKATIEPFLSDQWFVDTDDLVDSKTEPRASARADAQMAINLSNSIQANSVCNNLPSPDLSQSAVLVTWTTYGTWLPGDERGYVSRTPHQDGTHELHNLPGEPYDFDDAKVRNKALERMDGKPVLLNAQQAESVLKSIASACERNAIEPLAIAIMANHVHVLCQAERSASSLLQVLKGNTSKTLNEQYELSGSPRWWTKSGSVRRSKPGTELTAAMEYVKQQENPLCIWSFDDESEKFYSDFTSARAEARGSFGITLPNSMKSAGLAQAAMDAVHDERIKIFPSRYAKSYLDWLGEKRDWCISRQLWWGHRIPVWKFRLSTAANGQSQTNEIEREQAFKNQLHKLTEFFESCHVQVDVAWRRSEDLEDDMFDYYLCGGSQRAADAINGLILLLAHKVTPSTELRQHFQDENEKFESNFGPNAKQKANKLRDNTGIRFKQQDPDVLDTWFSSALWPFSTLGWPEQTQHLKQYYPGSVLITSRDIITNWVARMVMFGLYAIGEVPFDHVYIHPKILDGRGETMSKSKGNGVDPVDIIHTHGADALRYAMADMTTETQDIRMPVEYICPHCEKLVDQSLAIKAEEQSRKSRGIKLDRKLQPSDCHRVKCLSKECGKEFSTKWADDETKNELKIARETSDKFDLGRNFCNKLWNAARFAFMNLEGATCNKLAPKALLPEDRWILSTLSKTIRAYHQALQHYQFSASIKILREFFWENLCNWYIELTKPRLINEPRAKYNPDASGARAESQSSMDTQISTDTAKQVLAFCMDQMLRLFHPTLPFITERLWQQLNDIVPQRGLPGIAELNTDSQLIVSEFPPVEGYASLEDETIVKTFNQLQDATRGVRDLRTQCKVVPKDRVTVTIALPVEDVSSFESHAHIVTNMAGIGALTVDPNAKRPPNAASVNIQGLRIYVHDVSDDAAERKRATKTLENLEKQIKGKQSKLGNEKFVANAPPEVINTERKRLEEMLTQQKSLQSHLAELGS